MSTDSASEWERWYNEKRNKEIKNYTAPCFICGDMRAVGDLIRIAELEISTDVYLICTLCHMAFLNEGRTKRQIWEELKKLWLHRQNTGAVPSIFNETIDPIRLNKNPIKLEEIAELAWELEFNGKDFIKKLLG